MTVLRVQYWKPRTAALFDVASSSHTYDEFAKWSHDFLVSRTLLACVTEPCAESPPEFVGNAAGRWWRYAMCGEFSASDCICFHGSCIAFLQSMLSAPEAKGCMIETSYASPRRPPLSMAPGVYSFKSTKTDAFKFAAGYSSWVWDASLRAFVSVVLELGCDTNREVKIHRPSNQTAWESRGVRIVALHFGTRRTSDMVNATEYCSMEDVEAAETTALDWATPLLQTQRQVDECSDAYSSELSRWVENGVCSLCSNVLQVEKNAVPCHDHENSKLHRSLCRWEAWKTIVDGHGKEPAASPASPPAWALWPTKAFHGAGGRERYRQWLIIKRCMLVEELETITMKKWNPDEAEAMAADDRNPEATASSASGGGGGGGGGPVQEETVEVVWHGIASSASGDGGGGGGGPVQEEMVDRTLYGIVRSASGDGGEGGGGPVKRTRVCTGGPLS